MGGEASFKQVFAVMTHAGVISASRPVVRRAVQLLPRIRRAAPTNLGALLPMLDETSFLGTLFGMIDLFIIWWLIVLAIGLAVLYRRRTQPIAITLFGSTRVIAVCVAAFMSRVGVHES